MSTWIISPCKRSRVDELRNLLFTLGHPSQNVVVVTTMPDPVEGDDVEHQADHVVVFEKPGLLFGEWFNLGLDYIASQETDEKCEVLCVGSSLIGDPDVIPALRRALRDNNLTMCGPDMFSIVPAGQVAMQQHAVRTLQNRVLANCFMIDAALGLRFDPEFRWWYSDDDLEMQARQLGPVGNVGGVNVRMTHPDGHYLSEEQAQWAIEDRTKFVTKWGQEPW